MLAVFLFVVTANDLQTLPGLRVALVKALMEGPEGGQLLAHDGNSLGMDVPTRDG